MICKHCGGVIIEKSDGVKLKPEDIINMVCYELDISPYTIKKKTRVPEVVEARKICFRLFRKYLHMTYKAAGEVFDQDHTSAIHSVNTLNDLMDTDPEIKNRVEYLENAIGKLVN